MESASYPCAAVERAMKVHGVIVRAVDGRLTGTPSSRDSRDLGSADAAVGL